MKFLNYNPQELELEILEFWQKNKIVEKLREKHQKGKKFYFLEGPPYTSGRVHIGTAWQTSMKDIILRYKFDETLTKYAWKEDQDVAYRVARDYKLYKTPYARLYHNHSPVARSNVREVDYKKVINNYYIFQKNMPQTLKNKCCFYWSLLGLLLLGVARSVAERNLDYMIGRLNGIMELLVILTKSSQEWHKRL